MKWFPIAISTVLFAASSFAAGTAPAFNATLTVGKESRFVLIGGDGKPSNFLKLGESFDGYVLKAYDQKASALDLEQGGKITRVVLASDAAVINGGASAPATPSTIADATAVLDTMHFEQLLDRILAGVKRQQISAMGKMVGTTPPGVDPKEITDLQKRMVDEMMSGLSSAELKGEVARIYSEVFTKEELDAMAAFYATPMGQSLNDKQPAVSEKMQALMMTRMMAAMPKIQQMGREFGAQVRARQQAASGNAPAAPAPSPAPTPAPTPKP